MTIQENAYAKLNLTLDVLDRREDGYHNLLSVMQTVSLCDGLELTLGTGGPWRVTADRDDVPPDGDNLAFRAARAYYDAAGTDPDGLTVRITKRIPMQGGLGGGSADAAAVLRALNRADGDRFSGGELERIGEAVGSDVPFCVRGGTVLAEGRGERLTALAPLPECYFVLVQPGFTASTPALYAKLDSIRVPARPKTEAMLRALEKGDLQEIGCQMLNVFEYALLPDHDELFKIENALENCGALGTSMTGSGSVMFGLFANFDFAAAASMSLMTCGYRTFMAKNV